MALFVVTAVFLAQSDFDPQLWGSACGVRGMGRLPFLFVGRRDISLFLLGRREVVLISGRFYLQGEGRSEFSIYREGRLAKLNIILGRGEIGPPCRASVVFWITTVFSSHNFILAIAIFSGHGFVFGHNCIFGHSIIF